MGLLKYMREGGGGIAVREHHIQLQENCGKIAEKFRVHTPTDESSSVGGHGALEQDLNCMTVLLFMPLLSTLPEGEYLTSVPQSALLVLVSRCTGWFSFIS